MAHPLVDNILCTYNKEDIIEIQKQSILAWIYKNIILKIIIKKVINEVVSKDMSYFKKEIFSFSKIDYLIKL